MFTRPDPIEEVLAHWPRDGRGMPLYYSEYQAMERREMAKRGLGTYRGYHTSSDLAIYGGISWEKVQRMSSFRIMNSWGRIEELVPVGWRQEKDSHGHWIDKEKVWARRPESAREKEARERKREEDRQKALAKLTAEERRLLALL